MTREQLKDFENNLKSTVFNDGSQPIEEMLEAAEKAKQEGFVVPADYVLDLFKNGKQF